MEGPWDGGWVGWFSVLVPPAHRHSRDRTTEWQRVPCVREMTEIEHSRRSEGQTQRQGQADGRADRERVQIKDQSGRSEPRFKILMPRVYRNETERGA